MSTWGPPSGLEALQQLLGLLMVQPADDNIPTDSNATSNKKKKTKLAVTSSAHLPLHLSSNSIRIINTFYVRLQFITPGVFSSTRPVWILILTTAKRLSIFSYPSVPASDAFFRGSWWRRAALIWLKPFGFAAGAAMPSHWWCWRLAANNRGSGGGLLPSTYNALCLCFPPPTPLLLGFYPPLKRPDPDGIAGNPVGRWVAVLLLMHSLLISASNVYSAKPRAL